MPVLGRLHAATSIGVWLCANSVAAQSCPDPRVVSYAELRAAMGNPSYNIAAVPNWGRFQTEVFLRLLRDGLARDPAGGVIRIEADDWFRGFLDAAHLMEEEAHEGTRLSHKYQQGILLDFRRNQVVRNVRRGPPPVLAANVRISWPNGPTKFTYHDTVSEPNTKVTSQRVITYHLLVLHDDSTEIVWYDDMEGVSGRVTSGVLAALLSIFGERALDQTRMAIAEDVSVSRVHLRHTLGMKITVVVDSSGRAEKDIPAGRQRLADVEKRLTQRLEYEYFPYTC